MQNSIARKLMKGHNMTWNYRVVRFPNDEMGEYFEVKEVFYDKDGGLAGYSEASVFSETFDGLHETLNLFREAFAKPVIREEEFFTKGKQS